MQQSLTPRTTFLSVFSLVMITAGSVDSVRNLPATALFGSAVVFFFLLAAICFLVPAALVSAELSVKYPGKGGVYYWVSQAFGGHAGVFAVWFQWIENVIWYPTILSFIAGSVGYLISPTLVDNKYFIIAVILSAFWGTTFINLQGMKSSARFASFCAITGLIVPMTFIIMLGAYWVMHGSVLQISFTVKDMMPNLSNPDMWVSLTGIMLSLCGIEIATVHAGDVKNPQRAFPRALLYSTILIVSTLILGALSIAIVVPHEKISLVAGIMQAFNAFFVAYHINWLLSVMALSLVIGGLGSVNNWIIAPTRGLLLAAKDGYLPEVLAKENENEAPVVLLCAQAVIVTIIAAVFLLMPSVNASYWLLTALSGQLYMLMYIMMFAAAVKLRFASEQPSGFRIPGGKCGMWLVAAVGVVSCVVTIAVGFIPPSDINVGGAWFYDEWVTISLLLMTLPPLITYFIHKKKNR